MTDREDLPVVEGEIIWDPVNRTWRLRVPDDAPAGHCIVHAVIDLSTGDPNDMTIRDFIASRLDEDEAAARAVQDNSAPFDGQWKNDDNHALRTENDWVLTYGHHGRPMAPGLLDHIARHDPKRVLLDVAAARDVLARHFNDSTSRFDAMACIGCPGDRDGGYTVEHVNDCPELQALAWRWSDHSDWSLKWCPHLEGRREVEVTEVQDARYCYTNACTRCGSGDGWHYRDRDEPTL